MNLNNFRTKGVIYKIADEEYTKKGFSKRFIYVETPTINSMSQGTQVLKFNVFGDECGSLDFFEAGQWVSVLFRIEGRWWKPPDKDEEIHFQNLGLVDMQKCDNPFETKEKEPEPEDLSFGLFEDTEKRVKEFVGEKGGSLGQKNKELDDQLPF